MPAPHPPEFPRRAVELARLREKPVAEIAKDLGISGSCLRNWMSQTDVNEGKEGLTTDERTELVRLRRAPCEGHGDRDPQARQRLCRARERSPKGLTPLVLELAADGIPVAVTCRVLHLPRSTFYDAASRLPSAREVADGALTELITDVHEMSRGSYGSPRVHAELRLGLGLPVARKRVARLMRNAGLCGIGGARKGRRAT